MRRQVHGGRQQLQCDLVLQVNAAMPNLGQMCAARLTRGDAQSSSLVVQVKESVATNDRGMPYITICQMSSFITLLESPSNSRYLKNHYVNRVLRANHLIHDIVLVQGTGLISPRASHQRSSVTSRVVLHSVVCFFSFSFCFVARSVSLFSRLSRGGRAVLTVHLTAWVRSQSRGYGTTTLSHPSTLTAAQRGRRRDINSIVRTLDPNGNRVPQVN